MTLGSERRIGRVVELHLGFKGRARSRSHSSVAAGVHEDRIVTLGALTLENLLDPDRYKQAVVNLINEALGAAEITVADLPDLPVDGTSLWPKVIKDWAAAEGHRLPGKRVIASRLVEEGLAVPSQAGVEVLKTVHAKLSAVLDREKA